MKKILAYTVAILFVGVLSLTVLAFTDDDPKKQKTETATTEQCDKHKEAAETTETKSCCKRTEESASAGCQKSAAGCEHHDEETADEK